MKPELPDGTGTRGTLALLAALAGAQAAGIVLLADALATAIAQIAAGGVADAQRLLWWGTAGVLLRAAAAWATELAARRAGLGAKETIRARLVDAALGGRAPAPGADDGAGVEPDGAATPPTGHGAVSALASRGLDGLDDYYTRYLPALVTAAVVPPVILARILLADWVSALIVALTLPLVPVFMILIGLHTRDRIAAAAAGLDRLANQLMELAQGLPALIGLRRARSRGEALSRVSDAHRDSTMATLRTAFLSGMALELVATISVALVAVFIGLRLVHGTMGLEVGLFALMLAPECYLPLRALGAAFHSSEDGVEALRRARALLHPGAVSSAEGVPGAAHPPADGTVLRTRALDVAYPGRSDRAVAGFSLTLRAGETHVLDGPSGSGKTSILRAVAGRLAPGPDASRPDAAGPVAAGSVEVDRAAIAWVPQHPVFSEGTVEEELLLHAARTAADRDVEAALASVAAEGLRSRRLVDCSPGELRRVAVARALIRVRTDPAVRLLLADEPTAHLDAASAARVRGALAGLRGRVAMLVASHDAELAALLRGTGPADAREAAPARVGTAGSLGERGVPAAPDATGADTGLRPAGAGRATGPGGGHWALLRTLPWGRGGLLRGLAFAVLASLAAVGLTGVSGWLIVTASHQPPVLHLMVAIVGVRTFGIGRAVLRYAERLAVHDAILQWAGILRIRLWDALSTRPQNWGRLTRSGAALGHLVAEVDEVRDAVPRVLVPPAAGVLTWAAVAAAIVLWAPGALPAALAVGAAAFVALPLAVLAVERRSSAAVAAHRLWLGERVPTLLAAAADLSANGAAPRAAERFADRDARATAAVRRAAWGSGVAQAGAVLAAGLGAVAAVAAVGAHSGAGEAAAVGGLLLLALAEPVAETATSIQGIPALDDGLRRIAAGLDGAPTDGARTAEEGSERGADAHAADGADSLGLGLSAVGLGWGVGPDVVAGITARAVPGRWLAVTGPSGSGKSTVLACLLGALRPRVGRLEARTGGGAWRDAGPADTARVAWCPQEAHLFDSTVRRNVCLGRDAGDQPDDDELRRVIGRVGLGAWLEGAVDGLETRIGSGGHRLSGGQRQRLAVARALLARADVLLLDEPTAHLGDAEAAELIADLKAALGDKAVVLVTHDERLEAHADAVLRLGGPTGGAAPPETARAGGVGA
ncbi:MAG: thiol reductant ABC exporter subunit CydC [Arthrobacter sp.]|uniref:thiol reductant ABC exporter subunit CydC n=1 Tax=Arthrobacter sp. TaxID=1667 RepID=UPI00349367C1